MTTRRNFIALSSTGIAMVLAGGAGPSAAATGFEIEKTEAEWRAILTPAQYGVLREENTEPAGSSPLDKEHREGTFHCAGCDLALYSSKAKYDSGTGWPSFYEPLPNAVATKAD